jgi:hypothetical protein
MANRITKNPITSFGGIILVIIGMIGYYVEIDTTVCSMVVLGGLGLLGAKDTIFGGKENPKP